jgi:anti-sigma B factor antagonist
MQLVSRQVGDVTVLAIEGELTVPTAPGFLRRSRLFLASLDAPLVAVDLGAVRRVDSSGFATLVALARYVQRRGGDVCLVGMAPEARLLLEIMQLHLLFDVCEDMTAAIECLTANQLAPAKSAGPALGRRLLGRIGGAVSGLERRVAS